MFDVKKEYARFKSALHLTIYDYVENLNAFTNYLDELGVKYKVKDTSTTIAGKKQNSWYIQKQL